jgi:hypothetical protein
MAVLWGALGVLTAAGCRQDSPRAVAVELLEPGDDALPAPLRSTRDPVLRITFDRRVRPADLAGSLKLLHHPRRQWPVDFEPLTPAAADPPRDSASGETESRRLYVRVTSGGSELRVDGRFSLADEDPAGPSGIGVDLGRGVEWLDLQHARIFPELREVRWRDVDGDLVPSEGDLLALLFNRPVRLGADAAPGSDVAVRVPQDVILIHSEDRLDDGTRPAVFLAADQDERVEPGAEGGGKSDEVLIRLGANPRLLPTRTLQDPRPASRPAHGPGRVSSLAVNGTELQPMEKIRDARNGLGAISTLDREVRLPTDYPALLPLAESFPEPAAGTRIRPSVNPDGDGGLIILGGRSDAGGAAADALPRQIFRFAPEPRGKQPRLEPIGVLSEGRLHHSATNLPGKDGIAGTWDDPGIIIAGGTNNLKSLGSIEAIRLQRDGGHAYQVQPLRRHLRFPRYHHAAVAVPPDRILFLGGLDHDASSYVIGKAELLRFAIEGDGLAAVEAVEISALPRMQHTATLLGPRPDAPEVWEILVYGGFGRDPYRAAHGNVVPHDQPGDLLSPYDAAILAAPEILRLDLSKAESRQNEGLLESELVEVPFDFALLRYDHAAVPIAAAAEGRAPRAKVFIAGGSLRPLDSGTSLVASRRLSWQLPNPALAGTRDLQHYLQTSPRGNECAAALLFDPESSGTERLRILPSPAGDVRVHHGLVAIDDRAVFCFGGESSEPGAEKLASIEMFLPQRGLWTLFPLSLKTGKSHFAAASYASPGGGRSIFLIGGISGAIGQPNEADVFEELRLAK